MDVIRLKNMVFYGYHGVSESEKSLGGKFEVDLDLYQDLKKAGLSDNLKDTLNYEKIYKTVENCTKKNKYYLIETLAERIAVSILRKYKTDRVLVRVRKPHAPLKGVLDTVEVEIVRTKADYE
ncbi:MAG: dihydroneopterin aldolase [Candidatus Marinimicrobia bacterium]|nr:dihydroneopterin aldolase [Candidatus Neomarinimicrobiota bacterium]